MKVKARIILPLQSHKQLSALMDALKPEVEKQVGTRSIVALSSSSLSIILSVEAEDTVALRAALNAYLRWVNSASTVLNTLGRDS